MRIYLARDRSNELYIFKGNKPIRGKSSWEISNPNDKCYLIPEDMESIFLGEVDIAWEDDPVMISFERFDNRSTILKENIGFLKRWFGHIAQIADDRKTLTGVVMSDSDALDEIKSIAVNSIYFIKKHIIPN